MVIKGPYLKHKAIGINEEKLKKWLIFPTYGQQAIAVHRGNSMSALSLLENKGENN